MNDIQFAKKGTFGQEIERQCETLTEKANGLQYYCLEVNSDVYYFVDGSKVPFRQRASAIIQYVRRETKTHLTTV